MASSSSGPKVYQDVLSLASRIHQNMQNINLTQVRTSKNMNPKTNRASKAVAIAGCVATLFLCGNANAIITPTGPFIGNLSETWESFDNYTVGPAPNSVNYLPDPTTIMGGGAKISNPTMIVYQFPVALFGLGSSGFAKASDGAKGMGLYDAANPAHPPQTAMISFVNPVFDFGAFWGAHTSDYLLPAIVSLSFSDGSVAAFLYNRTGGDGVLEWHGWHSTIGITGISYTGDSVVIDGLQANTTPIPEASTWYAGIGASMALLGAFVRRTRK